MGYKHSVDPILLEDFFVAKKGDRIIDLGTGGLYENVSFPFSDVFLTGIIEKNQELWRCPCGYIYNPILGDPKGGIKTGVKFEDLPDNWVCPSCGLPKDRFEKMNE